MPAPVSSWQMVTGQAGTGSITNSHLPPQPKTDVPKLKAKTGEEQTNVFFNSFRDDLIFNMATSELLSLLLKGILFCFGLFSFVYFGFLVLFLFFGSLAAMSPSTGSPASSVSSLGSRWGQLPTLEVEGSLGPSSARNTTVGCERGTRFCLSQSDVPVRPRVVQRFQGHTCNTSLYLLKGLCQCLCSCPWSFGLLPNL